MCGLVGMAGDMTFKHKSVMKTLLFLNSLRGMDSTGLTVYDAEKRVVDTRKTTVPGFEFIGASDIDTFLGYPYGIWLGHSRAATVGSVSRLNAHPFEVYDDNGNICLFGAHNGTLQNKGEIEKALDRKETFGTDSEALLNLIADYGAKDALAEARGAWALAWWYYEDDSLNLLRNSLRPLHYAVTEDGRNLIWASEAWMIRVACSREDVKLQRDEVWSLPEDTLFTWELPDKKQNQAFPEPIRKGGILGKPEEPKFLEKIFGDCWTEEEKKKEGKGGKAEALKKTHTLIGFGGEMISPEFSEMMMQKGCDWCGDEIRTRDFAWLDKNSVACRRCLRGEHIFVDVQKGTILNITTRLPVVEKKGNKR